MSKNKTIKLLNAKIDLLIIQGETNTPEFKRLMRLHKIILLNN